MKIASTLIAVGLTITPLFADVDLSKLPPVSGKKGLTYEKDIRPIFEASCFRCHGEERHRGELRLDSLEAALKGGEDGKVILPGKSKESPLVIAVAQLDDEKAMPPKRGPGGPGGPGGAGGPGGRGGFGPGNMIASQLMAQGDKDQDKKLTKSELSAVADSWFVKMDAEKSGKLSQQQFVEKFGEILPPPQGGGRNAGAGGPPPGGGPGGNGGRGFNPGQFIGPGFFTAVDTDKDGTLTRAEFKGAFEKWFAAWDTDKSGSLDETKLRAGLNAALPRPNFGGGLGNGPGGNPPGNGPGQRQGGGSGQGPGGGAGGTPPKPLTPEQVGLVRAWIDQGAK